MDKPKPTEGATPRTHSRGHKAQFSAMMKPEVKRRLGLLANIRGQSISQCLEDIIVAELDSVDPQVWDLFLSVQTKAQPKPRKKEKEK
jgi:hypothetical protein